MDDHLRRNPLLLSAVIGHMPVALFVKRAPDFRYVLFNPAAERLLGVQQADVLGRTDFDLMPMDVASILRAEDEHVTQTRQPLEVPARMVTSPALGHRVFQIVKVPFLDDDNGLTYVIGIFDDVTAQRQAEAALQVRHEEFRALAENAPDPIARFDPQFRYVYANRATASIAGMPVGDILGRTSEEIGVNPRLVAQWHAVLGRVFETGLEGELEFEIETPDGLRYLQSRVVPEHTADGQIETVLAIVRDVSHIRHSEASLRVYSQRLEVMHRVYQSIFAAESPEDVGNAALRHIHDLAPCRWANVAVLDHDAQALRIVASWHADDSGGNPVETGRQYRIGPAAQALRKARTPQAISRLCGDSEFMACLRDRGLTLMAPLIARGELIGLLSMALTDPGEPSEEVSMVLGEVAAQLALTLEDTALMKSVREQREQLYRLAARMAETQEVERRRLAIELHDRVGQNLTALGINLNIVRSLISRENMASIGPKLDTAMGLLEETVDHIRDVMADLRPPVLDDYGLLAALRWFCKRFTERMGVEAVVETVVEGQEPAPRLDQMVEIGLFRIAQEALTNAAKHAHASSVVVRLDEVDGVVRLSISDNGTGFDLPAFPPTAGHTGWGLVGMQERAAAVGGRLHIESSKGAGTRVLVEIPR